MGIRSHGEALPTQLAVTWGSGRLFNFPLVEGEGAAPMRLLVLPFRALGFTEKKPKEWDGDPVSDHLVQYHFFGSWRHHPPSLLQVLDQLAQQPRASVDEVLDQLAKPHASVVSKHQVLMRREPDADH